MGGKFDLRVESEGHSKTALHPEQVLLHKLASAQTYAYMGAGSNRK